MFISRPRFAKQGKTLRTLHAAVRVTAEALERRVLLSARMGPDPFYDPTAEPRQAGEIHGDEYFVPPARVEPGPHSKFTGHFVVTLAEGISSVGKAKQHGGKHSHAFYMNDKTHLWEFAKGSNEKQIEAALKKDKAIVDAYPVYTEVLQPTGSNESLLLSSDLFESEPNDTAGTADPITVSAAPLVIGGAISSSSDVDFFSFTLSQRSGVFFDIDSMESGLSATLDSILTLFNSAGTTQLAQNDDGRDFDGFALNDDTATGLPLDSALYMDLNAGTYNIRVSSFGQSTGSYQLKVFSDSTFTGSVPVFNSNLGAADTLFLDFDGHSASDAWGTYSVAAYDFSGNAGEWNPAERRAIENIWRVVADAFSPFNINVTTSYAGSYSPEATAFRQVITNNNGAALLVPGALGVALMNSYATNGPGSKTAFTFAPNFNVSPIVGSAGVSGEIMAKSIEIANTSVHEFGHALGLRHYGTPGDPAGADPNPQPNAVMATPDFGLNRERWVAGFTRTAEPPVLFQDDLAVIGNLTNTLGLRADDHGDSRAAATVLLPVGNDFTGAGIITTAADVDYFSFTGSGVTTVTLDIPEHLHRLHGEVRLYDDGGALLASASEPDRLSASLNFPLPSSGDYYVEVRSNSGAGAIGQYSLRVNTSVAGGGSGSIAGRVFRDTAFDNLFDAGAGDAALAGVTVFLDGDNDGVLDPGELSILSDSNGDYLFPGLADGTYHVGQIVPSGYVSDVSHTLLVSGGTAHSNVQFGNWPIVYHGSAGADTWTLRLKPGDATRLQLLENLGAGPLITYEAPHSIVTSLTVNGGSDDDVLTVQSTPAFLPVEFNGQGDSDELILTAGANATVVFDGGSDSGFDTATYNATDAAEGITVTDVEVSGGGNVLTYFQIEELTLNALGGADTVVINGDAVASSLVINGGEGDDTVQVGGGDLDELPSGVTVNGGAGNDLVVLNDEFNTFGDQYDVDASSVIREFFGGLDYAQIEGLVLNAQLGANIIILASTAAATPVTINGGGGNDTLIHNGASSAVVFNGGLEPLETDELHVNGGTFTFADDAALGTANLTVRVAVAAAVVFNASQHLAGLHVDGGTATLSAGGSRLIDTRALSVSAGRLDLKDNDMIVRDGDLGTWNGSAYTGVRGLVDTGRGIGLWDGSGVVTTMAQPNDRTTLGVASAAELFGIGGGATATWQGEVVSGGDVLVKYTWGGDASLDGKINIDDYGRIDGNVSQSGVVFGFNRGDFNYDGKINIDDYGVIDGTINQQTGTL